MEHPNKPFKGTLENYKLVGFVVKEKYMVYVLVGRYERFRALRTSIVLRIYTIDGRRYAETLNSIYRLGKYEEG